MIMFGKHTVNKAYDITIISILIRIIREAVGVHKHTVQNPYWVLT